MSLTPYTVTCTSGTVGLSQVDSTIATTTEAAQAYLRSVLGDATLTAVPYVPPVIDPKVALAVYASAKWSALSNGGLTVNGVLVGTDDAGKALLNGAVLLAMQAPTQAFSWSVPGGKVALTATQVIAIGVAVGQFIQRSFVALQTVEAEINDGTITTTAAIDAYAWPTS